MKNKRKTKCKPDSDVLYRRCCGAKMQDALRPLEGRWKLMIMAHGYSGEGELDSGGKANGIPE